MKIVYSGKFLEHDTGNYPENRRRLEAILATLKENGLNDFVEPKPAPEKDLLLVHEQALIDEIRLRSKRVFPTPDNPFNSNTLEIAKLSAGAASDAAGLCEKEFAFSLARPPGHHAGIRTFGGFCYFNNIAYAARKAQRDLGYEKVLIVDFDVHLGQGTLEIFQDDPSVFYLSLHQDPETIYPWRDYGAERNSTRKIALFPGTSDEQFLEAFNSALEETVSEFKPDLVGASAGFDAFHADSMVGSNLNVGMPETFFEIGRAIKGIGKPCFGVLEGGYNLETLGVLAHEFLRAFY